MRMFNVDTDEKEIRRIKNAIERCKWALHNRPVLYRKTACMEGEVDYSNQLKYMIDVYRARLKELEKLNECT